MGYPAKNFLVLNLGLRSIRAIVFDSDGEKLATSAERVRTRVSGKEVEQDPERWWKLAAKVIRVVQRKVESGRTGYITVTSSACNLVPVDEENKPTHPSLLVSDRRSTSEAEWIRENESFRDILSGNNFSASPSYLPPKVLWLKRNHPRVYDQTDVFGSSNSYLTSKFVGRHITDRLDAEKFFHRAKKGYPSDLLSYLDLTNSNLPEVVPVGTEVGEIKADVAKDTALPTDALFIITTYDALAAFWGAGATKAGDAGNVCGTCSSLRVYTNSEQKIDTGKSKVKSQYFARPDVTVVGGSNSLEGGLLEWVKSTLYTDNAMNSKILYDKMEEDASKIPPGARGITFLPYLLGERAPFSDPHARGVFFGLERRHGRSEMVRSVFESIGFLTRDMVESVEKAGAPINHLKVAGGLTRRRLACQLKADVTGIPVTLVDEMENTALGCMLIMYSSISNEKQIEGVADNIVQEKETFRPKPERHKYYEDYFELFKDVYYKNKDLFEKREQMTRNSRQINKNL